MVKIYLPQRVGERYDIKRRLRFREILQWQEEKAAKPQPPKPAPRFSRDQIVAGLKDLRDFQQAQQEGRRRLY
jgi:hypothetical protein